MGKIAQEVALGLMTVIAGYSVHAEEPASIEQRCLDSSRLSYTNPSNMCRKYFDSMGRMQRHEIYMKVNMDNRADLKSLFADTAKLKGKIYRKLMSVSHRVPPAQTERDHPSVTFYLSDKQLQRVYLILESLDDLKFRRKLGKLLRADVKEKYCEHGGIVILDEKQRVDMYPMESRHCKNKNPKGDGGYLWPKTAGKYEPYLAAYHFHALTSNCSYTAVPSLGDKGGALSEYRNYGESFNIVVTTLEGPEFNVDFYTWRKSHDGKPLWHMLDLGVYSTEK